MDRKPFEPADGVTPRWQKLYNLVLNREVGDEITYREAHEVVGLDWQGLHGKNLPTVQEAMRDAMARLEKNGERTVGTRPKFGWVVLDATRELQQVDRRLTKTRRAAGRTVRGSKALSTRRGELSQFERERLDRIAHAASMAAQMTGRRGMNLDDLKKAIEGGQSAIG